MPERPVTKGWTTPLAGTARKTEGRSRRDRRWGLPSAVARRKNNSRNYTISVFAIALGNDARRFCRSSRTTRRTAARVLRASVGIIRETRRGRTRDRVASVSVSFPQNRFRKHRRWKLEAELNRFYTRRGAVLVAPIERAAHNQLNPSINVK